MEGVLDDDGVLGQRFRDAVNRDALSRSMVVANVADVNARPRRTGSDSHGLPIFEFHPGQPDASCDRSSSVKRDEHGVTGIIVRPQPAR